jgi:hypothetical protein
MGTGSLSPGVKRPGQGVNHLSTSGAEIKESRSVPVRPLPSSMNCFKAKFSFNLYLHFVIYSTVLSVACIRLYTVQD